MLDAMSETTSTPEPATRPVATTAPQQPAYVEPERRRARLTAVAAWVGIVAGVVFVVAVIFFSGFVLGAHSGGGHRGHQGGGDREFGVFHRGGPPMFPIPPMGPGPRGGFERQGPGGGPGASGVQPSEAPQPPTTSAPARP